MKKLAVILYLLPIFGCFSPTDRVEKVVFGKIKISGIHIYPDDQSGGPNLKSPNALYINDQSSLNDFEIMRQDTVLYLAERKENKKAPEKNTFIPNTDYFWCDLVLEKGGKIRYKLYFYKKTGSPIFMRDSESDVLLDHELHFVQGSSLFTKIQNWISKRLDFVN